MTKYRLYDLEITTVGDQSTFNCSHTVDEGLLVEGENIRFKENTAQFSHYVLATLIPYLAAKQRAEQATDWMKFESDIACPDPQCGAKFRIIQTQENIYEYQPV
jgi:uncharacterized repeat protein (TIGR04076 family)